MNRKKKKKKNQRETPGIKQTEDNSKENCPAVKRKQRSSGSSNNLAMYNAAHDGLQAYKMFLCGLTLTYTT